MAIVPNKAGSTPIDLPLGVIEASKDAGPDWTTAWGIANLPYSSGDATAGVAVTDAPTAGMKLVLDDLTISTDTPMAVTLKCETTNVVLFGPINVLAGVPYSWTSRGKGVKAATADKKIKAFASAVGNITVHAGYHSEV